jgi:cobalt-zinc-cadmium efflux system membrane fusion protein
MMKRRWIFSAAVVVMLALAGVFLFKRSSQGQAEPAPSQTQANGIVQFRMEQQWLIRLKLAVAEEAELPPQLYSIGRVVPSPANRAIVAPPVAGIIENRTLPRIGDHVIRGQVLTTIAEISSPAEIAQIQIENNRVEAERRRLNQLEIEIRARLGAANAEAGRAKRLLEQKAYSQRQLEMAEADRQVAEANLASVQEQMRALQTAPLRARYEIVAPLSGTVVNVKKAAGEEVRPGENILEIVALDTVWVEAPVFEKDLGRIARNAAAVFTTPAFPEEEFHGRLVDIGAIVDEQTRAAKAVFEVPNTAGKLRLGMQANLRLSGGDKRLVLLVPKESVLDNEGKKIVYVLRTGEEFERRDVIVGEEYGDKLAIVSGVMTGERVVTQGAYQLKLQELRPANAGAHTHEV